MARPGPFSKPNLAQVQRERHSELPKGDPADAPSGEVFTTTRELGLGDPHETPRPPRAIRQLSASARPTRGAAGGRPMAPGVGGPNIDPPWPKTNATEATRGRPLRNPEPPIQTPRGAAILRQGTSFVFVATVAIMGLMLLAFPDVAQKPTGDIPDVMTPSHEGSGAKIAAHSARLLVESQKGFANEPVRLGVSLVGAEGGEIVTVEGLADGADLSLGSLSTNGWQVSSADLDSTFVGPPKGFVGVMNAMVNLRSASGQLLQSQVLRFEWIEEPNPGPKLALAPSQSSQGDAPLDSRQIAALIKLAQGRLKAGDIASARLLLKPAANAGNAQAALDLGMTFDPDLLVRRGVLGIAPDAAQAREWYARAIRLGSPEAERHLKRLMSTPR